MNRFARKLAIPLCFAMLVGVACGKDKKNNASKSSDTKTTKADIKVGAIFDLSGATADVGTPYSEGIKDFKKLFGSSPDKAKRSRSSTELATSNQ